MPPFRIYGPQRHVLPFSVNFPAGTGLVEAATDAVLGHNYILEKAFIVTDTVATGAGASRVLQITKGASTVAATRTFVLADGTPVGKSVDFTNGTEAARTFGDADTLTIEWIAAGAVAFTAGRFTIFLVVRQLPQKVA